MITETVNWCTPAEQMPVTQPAVVIPVEIQPIPGGGKPIGKVQGFYSLDTTGADLSWQGIDGSMFTTAQVAYWCARLQGPLGLIAQLQ